MYGLGILKILDKKMNLKSLLDRKRRKKMLFL